MSSKGQTQNTKTSQATTTEKDSYQENRRERDTSRAYFSLSADGERSKNTSCLQNFCPLHLLPDAEDYKKDFQIKQHFKKLMCKIPWLKNINQDGGTKYVDRLKGSPEIFNRWQDSKYTESKGKRSNYI